MKTMSNTRAIMIVSIGLFVIVSTVAILVRLYEIGGTKKAPLFAGELEEKIDYLSSNHLREYIGKVGIEYGATTNLRNFSCVIGPHFKVEKMEFSIDSLLSKGNIRLFRYKREEGKTVIENLSPNFTVIKVDETSQTETGTEEAEEKKRVTVEQFSDALRFYLPTKGREGPENLISLELKLFESKEKLVSFVEETGVPIYSRQDGEYQLKSYEDAGYVFLYETNPDGGEPGAGALYELEYY